MRRQPLQGPKPLNRYPIAIKKPPARWIHLQMHLLFNLDPLLRRYPNQDKMLTGIKTAGDQLLVAQGLQMADAGGQGLGRGRRKPQVFGPQAGGEGMPP